MAKQRPSPSAIGLRKDKKIVFKVLQCLAVINFEDWEDLWPDALELDHYGTAISTLLTSGGTYFLEHI